MLAFRIALQTIQLSVKCDSGFQRIYVETSSTLIGEIVLILFEPSHLIINRDWRCCDAVIMACYFVLRCSSDTSEIYMRQAL